MESSKIISSNKENVMNLKIRINKHKTELDKLEKDLPFRNLMKALYGKCGAEKVAMFIHEGITGTGISLEDCFATEHAFMVRAHESMVSLLVKAYPKLFQVGIFGSHYLSEEYSSLTSKIFSYGIFEDTTKTINKVDEFLLRIDINVVSRDELKELDLSGVDLQGINLVKADLRRINLERANLQGANLWGAVLLGASLKNADLQNADLRESDNRYAKLQYANMQGADLRGANFNNVSLLGADFRNADLRGAKFHDADLRDAKLEGARVEKTDLRFANLIGSDWRKLDLKKIEITGAKFFETSSSGDKFNEGSLSGVKVRYEVQINF